jgi:NAD(P)-dependent dehydrogenase (short-subunit alcohol dehydrogenase family)
MRDRLKGKVAIVTGTGAGIGKSIVSEFTQEGAKVIAASRRASTGQPVIDEIVAAGGKATFVQTDVSKESDVKNLINETIRIYGKVDILVNNAGVNFVKPFEEVEPSDWDFVLNTDLRGTYLCCYFAIKEMLIAGKGGSIINVATVHTLACLPGAVPYDAAKWGMIGLTKSLAVEFASRGIRVNALSPGLIDTQIWDDIKTAAPNLDNCLTYWNSNIPMGRVGTCQEISKTAVFMASDDATYMTGSNILIDGGMTSQLISQEPYESQDLDAKPRQ